jgi:mRNA interferase MazF
MIFKQGDIIKFDFDPVLGHEQGGYRPAVVISREIFNRKTGQIIVCPITQTDRPYPTRIFLDGHQTQGFIICEHLKTIDVKARKPKLVERIGEEYLDKILIIVDSAIQKD